MRSSLPPDEMDDWTVEQHAGLSMDAARVQLTRALRALDEGRVRLAIGLLKQVESLSAGAREWMEENQATPTPTVEPRARRDDALSLKPIVTAPRPGDGDDFVQLLVLDAWQEGGQPVQGWKLVYWLDAWNGRPAGWYGNNCGDLRRPIGWVLSTDSLPTPPDAPPSPTHST